MLAQLIECSVNAISSGAVLRSLETSNGPPRLGQSSYGFLRKEPYQKDIWDGHKRIVPERDEVDGELYVTVINYFMIKVRFYFPMQISRGSKERVELISVGDIGVRKT